MKRPSHEFCVEILYVPYYSFGVIRGRFYFIYFRNLFRDCSHETILRVFMASLFFISLTGCVSAKYKMAAEDTPPPVPLNITAASHPVEGAVDTVIILGGPGSWKQEAYWDEYVLSVTNHGGTSVTLESATLIDLQDNPVMPGDVPWDLQEQSKAWVEHYNSGTTGVVLKVGAASGMTGAIVGAAALAGETYSTDQPRGQLSRRYIMKMASRSRCLMAAR